MVRVFKKDLHSTVERRNKPYNYEQEIRSEPKSQHSIWHGRIITYKPDPREESKENELFKPIHKEVHETSDYCPRCTIL